MKLKIKAVPLIIWLIQLLAEGALIFGIRSLGMLPDAFTAVIAIVLVLMLGISAWLLLGGHSEKDEEEDRPGFLLYIRRILGAVLALAMTASSVFCCSLVSNAKNTVNDITQVDAVSDLIGIYVRMDDPAKELSDTKKYSFGRTDAYDPGNSWSAITWIEEQLGKNVTVKEYEVATDLVDGLLGKDCDVMILNEAYYNILHEMEAYADIDERVRLLDEYEVVEEVEETEAAETEAETQSDKYGKEIYEHPFIVYLSGSDTRSKMLSVSNSDVNILMVVNPVTRQILLVNTPRDYFIPNPVGGGALDKLTHLGIFGVKNSMQGLGNLYDCKVNYYCQINFTGFETLIDAVGGVTVNNERRFSNDEYTFEEGSIYLDGKKALSYCRDRYHQVDGDNARGRHQMMVINGIIDQISNNSSLLLTNYSEIMTSLSGMFKTDVTTDEISDLVKFQLSELKGWTINTYAVTGYDGKDYTYSMPRLKAYVMIQNKDSVAKAASLIKQVTDGEEPDL